MSTKNLARTVIEGGRCGHYKQDVSTERRSERTHVRSFLRGVLSDPEEAESMTDPRRREVRPCFQDKTRPLAKFLDSRVGKSWAETYSMIRQRFDVRTTPGRHVVEDHLLSGIAFNGEHLLKTKHGFRFHTHFVDRNGILQFGPSHSSKKASRRVPFIDYNPKELLVWLKGRTIGQCGDRFLWWSLPGHTKPLARFESEELRFYETDDHGEILMFSGTPYFLKRSGIPDWREGRLVEGRPIPVRINPSQFRSTGLLRPSEEAFFLTLPRGIQIRILATAPRNYDAKGPVTIESPTAYPVRIRTAA